MSVLHNMSIARKLTLVILLICGSVLLLASGAFVVNDLLKFRANLITRLFTMADLASFTSDVGLVFQDAKTVKENISLLQADRHIRLAHVFAEDGSIFATYRRKEDDQTGDGLPYNTLDEYYFDRPAQASVALNTPKAEAQLDIANHDAYFFRSGRLEVFKRVFYHEKPIGTVYIQSDLGEFLENLIAMGIILAGVLAVSLLLTLLLGRQLQKIITTPIYCLVRVMDRVCETGDYSPRAEKIGNDELGSLAEGFNLMLDKIEVNNSEITKLNTRLTAENLRMGAELDVTRRLQRMVLPDEDELQQIRGLEIAGFMQPAEEVGGDYYDVLQCNGMTKIGIGDVTGHGLESGVLMLMVQTAVRTLQEYGVTDPKVFMNALNRTLYNNVQRMNSDKNLTLSLLDYREDGCLHLVGQHEDVVVVRQGGKIERIDTIDLGFMVGLQADISAFVARKKVQLEEGDVVVLYTDGLTESRDLGMRLYGLNRLCEVVSQHWQKSALDIQRALIADVRRHIGTQKVYDDITLLVLKRVPLDTQTANQTTGL